MDHAQDDRLHARPRNAAELVADGGPESVDVDLQSQNCVRDDERVGTGRFRGKGDCHDVAGIGRELHPHRLRRRPPDALGYIVRVVLVHGEIAAIGIARRARDVDLDHVDIGMGRDFARHGLEIIRRDGGDGSDQRRREARVIGHLMLEEVSDPLGRQADRIDHAIADAVFARHRLRHERAQPVDVDHLRDVGRERARRRHDRVLQRDVPDLDRKIYHPTHS